MKNKYIILLSILWLITLSTSFAQDTATNSNSSQIKQPLAEGSVQDIFELIKPAATETQASSSLYNSSSSSMSDQNTEDKEASTLGILDIEEHLATSRFNEKSNLLERAVIVRVYERIALAVCFPKLSGLLKGIKLTSFSKRCQYTLIKLDNLHSNNAIAKCARNGVDSVECSESFETLGVRKYNFNEFEKISLTGKKQSTIDSPEIKPRFDQLQKKLLEIIEKFKKEKSILNLKSLDAALYPVLNLICSDDALELTTSPAISPRLLNSNGMASNSLADAIAELNAQEQNAKATPTTANNQNNENIYYRTRILTDACLDTIKDVLEIDGRLSSAICYRDGFIAPSCLSAIRRLQTLSDPPAAGTPSSSQKPVDKKGKDGLATF